MRKTINYIAFSIVAISFLVACKQEANYFPKPNGYYRINLPKSDYAKTFNVGPCPFTFELPTSSYIKLTNGCNHNIYFPSYKAVVYSTFLKLDERKEEGSLLYHTEFSRRLAYEHSIKADQIFENRFENDTNNVYGIVYEIEGNVATNYQFYLTDSNDRFYRGSLYFETAPNIDSVQPVLDHLKLDLKHLIETFEWK